MIIKCYSQKIARLDSTFKKYLISLASLVDLKNPLYIEFKNSKVYVEQRKSIFDNRHFIELNRKLDILYIRKRTLWKPEYFDECNKIQQEFRDFLSDFEDKSFLNRHNQTLLIANVSRNRYDYDICSDEVVIGKLIMYYSTKCVRICVSICNKNYYIPLVWEYGNLYTHRDLWQYIIRVMKIILHYDDWKLN